MKKNPIRFIKKAPLKSRAVITILGTIGNRGDEQAIYKINKDSLPLIYKAHNTVDIEAINVFSILIKAYAGEYEIVPLCTKEAKEIQEKVLERINIDFDWSKSKKIEDVKDINAIFSLFHDVIESYDEVIIDVSHGFRHLPLLMLIDLMISNFNNPEKIQKILFAKQIEEFKIYEFMDLKDYMDLANISFILTSFEKNYTIASHIKSSKYQGLIDALNTFSNDIMALNLNNLFNHSSKTLIRKLKDIDDISIKTQAEDLVKKLEVFVQYEGKKRYQTYFDLSKNLLHKNYTLLSLALLFESIRMYIKTSIKKEHLKLVEFVEKEFKYDLYKIGDFFKNLSWMDWDTYTKRENSIKIDKSDYEMLVKSYRGLNIKDLYDNIDKKRNNLAHANSDNKSFKDIKKDIEELIKKYEEQCISRKDVKSLSEYLSNR